MCQPCVDVGEDVDVGGGVGEGLLACEVLGMPLVIGRSAVTLVVDGPRAREGVRSVNGDRRPRVGRTGGCVGGGGVQEVGGVLNVAM